MITPESQQRLSNCFSSDEEVWFLSHQLGELGEELDHISRIIDRSFADQLPGVLLKQICAFTLFCQQNMDLIHQLVSQLETEEVDQDEAKRISEE